MKKLNSVVSRNFFLSGMTACAIILGLFFALSSCSKNSSYSSNNPVPPSSNPNQVIMQNTSYNPKTLTIAKGDTVTWVNKDSFDHTVTSGTPGNPSGLFDSGNIGPNGTFSYVFTSTGTFLYYCKIHLDKMTGTIIVQ